MALLIPQRGTFGQRLLGLSALVLLSYYVFFMVEWRGSGATHHVGGIQNSDASLSHILNSTLGFQKLMVLNMPSRTDRRDATALAAAVSDLEIEFVDGVSGDSIVEEALPPGKSAQALKLGKGIRGSWRGHMNALHRIIQQNLTTAVIFEDDVDWDIRLRSQLQMFARASQFLSSESDTDLSRYRVQTVPNPETEESIHNDSSRNPIAKTLFQMRLADAPLSRTHNPKGQSSPYGDPANWDILWLGHCGVGFPRPIPPPPTAKSQANISSLLLTLAPDVTVPLPQYLRAHPFGPLDALASSHPEHTRVYHRATGGALCTVAYAVSQRGARRLLYEFGVKGFGRIFDVEMGEWCAGGDAGEKERVCLTSQPPVFAHHHPEGGESNIGGVGGGYARTVETKYVRQSVRMNLERLVRGEKDLKDQWPG